ncbi:MAG: DUF1573 domain-containing protein [Flavobacteriales bacterium]
MSNGLKVGLLIVIAGALGFLVVTQLNKEDGIGSRAATENAVVENAAVANQPAASQPGARNAPNEEVGAASKTRPKTTLKFDKTEHDFGKLKQGDKVQCVFKVTNTGNEALVIEDAKGSCGCTVPEYPKEPIPPGQTRDITVKFDSTGKSKNQQKTVTLTCNTEPMQTAVSIKSWVDAPADAGKEAAK